MCHNYIMKKIGILGGTFNPVHYEHIELVRQAKSELGLDKVIVVPTFMPPHKKTDLADGEDRLNMLRLAFKDLAEVSDFEIRQGGTSYTYLTLEHFTEAENDSEFYFICGGDMLTDFKTWKYPEKILKMARLVVFGREDFFTDYEYEERYFKEHFNDSFIKLKYKGKDFSSTKIRLYSSLGLSLDGVAIPEVAEYILSHGLYSGDKYSDFVKKLLPEKRLKHTANVVVCALRKVKELNLDSKKVYISAMLHDCAKYLDSSEFKDFKLPSNIPKPVEHSFLGAYVVEKLLGVDDLEIIDAIKYHTSGKANMSTLGKLIFVADMIEEDRNYEGVSLLRDYFKKDFELCFKECLKEEMLHLINKKQPIYIETINAYDFYVKGEN